MIPLASCLFSEKYLQAMDKYIMVILPISSALCAGEAPDEKLKIDKLGPTLQGGK